MWTIFTWKTVGYGAVRVDCLFQQKETPLQELWKTERRQCFYVRHYSLYDPETILYAVQDFGQDGYTNCWQLILLNDFACRENRLHNADWFKRMIALGSIQRYAV